MKLLILIPCYNEALTLGETIADLPTEISGIESIELLVVDDGSRDDTSEIARQLGVRHLIRHHRNLGLARAFETGIEACLLAGADIIATTDADNQYRGDDLPLLIQPLLDDSADVVIGDRQPGRLKHFPKSKRCLQVVGSWVVRLVSGVNAQDAVCGFRAITSEVAMQTHLISSFSPCVESIVFFGAERFRVASVPIRTNRVTRPSRLFTSTGHFVYQQAITLIRSIAFYRTLRFYAFLTLFSALIAWPISRGIVAATPPPDHVSSDHVSSDHVSSAHVSSAHATWSRGLWFGGYSLQYGCQVFIAVVLPVLLVMPILDQVAFNRKLIKIDLAKKRRIEIKNHQAGLRLNDSWNRMLNGKKAI